MSIEVRGLNKNFGDFVALDDDDTVLAHYVATFKAAAAAHEGRLLRTVAVRQDVVPVGDDVPDEAELDGRRGPSDQEQCAGAQIGQPRRHRATQRLAKQYDVGGLDAALGPRQRR